MELNADFSKRVVIATDTLPWAASPQAGVERRMLDRIGDEVARATSLVRYAPASAFPAHAHALGEEFLVLEGVFSDEHGDYPVGTYVRNPPGSGHAPRTGPGCVIFVKLRQMPQGERVRVVVDTRAAAWLPGDADGQARLPLFDGDFEQVAIERLEPGCRTGLQVVRGGEEILVLSGCLADEHGSYPAGTWVRNPPGWQRAPFSALGATFWVKRGHLGGSG